MGFGMVGAGINAASQLFSGIMTSESDQYNAAIAENNAILAKKDATWTMQSGEASATNEGMKTRALVGREKASQGASGVDVNSGSAVEVRAGTSSIGMLDAMTIRSNAARQSYGYTVQAVNDTAQANLDKSASTGALIGGALAAAGDIATGIGGAPTSPAGIPAATTAGGVGGPMQLSGATSPLDVGGSVSDTPMPEGIY
jgi:hypothetical protein